MYPFSEVEFERVRAIRVRDFAEVPMPLLLVQRAEPEGTSVKATKSGKGRRVPIADRILPLVREMAAGRSREEHLFVTSSGHRLHASAFKQTLSWSALSEGRRIHDLRHTAACLWLARGVCTTSGRGCCDRVAGCCSPGTSGAPAPSSA